MSRIVNQALRAMFDMDGSPRVKDGDGAAKVKA
jgi:hypothetical protein